MKHKKAIIWIVILIIPIVILGIMNFSKPKDSTTKVGNNEIINESAKMVGNEVEVDSSNNVLNTLSALAGIKATNVEIINSPIGIKGEVSIPVETIKNGLEYFLQRTGNDKMSDLKVEMHESGIRIYVNYRVIRNIKTSVMMKANLKLNKDKDLVISIDEVKLLDLKISSWLVNKVLDRFIQDWFTEDSHLKIDFENGNVIIYKENFKGIRIEEISMYNNILRMKGIIDMETMQK